MRRFLSIAVFLFALPASGQNYLKQHRKGDTECKGVVHGVVVGEDGKPWVGVNLILEPVGSYDFVFPRTKTDSLGQYRFSEVSCGGWGVFIEDKEAGYPQSGRMMYWFLYGRLSPQVAITQKHLDAQLNVNALPRPGILFVHLADSRTKASIPRIEIELKVTRKRWMQASCGDTLSSTCGDHTFLVSPDQDVILHVNAKGFNEWKNSLGRGKLIHLAAGDVMTIEAEMDPLQN